MITITVIYPREEGATFDFDYYVASHLPLVSSTWREAGLVDVKALRGLSTPDGGEPTFLAMALISFDSPENVRIALGGEAAAAIMGDLPNFTNVSPVVQLNHPLG